MNIVEKVQSTILKSKLLSRDETVVVGTSGGADSVCLLHILHGLGYRVEAAHLNHSLRAEAEQDARYVQELTEKLQIPFHLEKADVAEIARTRKISVETAGREVRHEFFARLGAKIATAHNLNDDAESFIMHLMRGSGMSGLVGIRPLISMKGMTIIRPLIACERSEIEEFCRERELNPRVDETNALCDYTRNDVRHNIMPSIIERGGLAAISRAADILGQEEDFLQGLTEQLIGSEKCFDIEWFNGLHTAIKRRVLRRMLKKSAQMLHIDAIIDMSSKNYGGKIIQLPEGGTAKLILGRVNIEY